MSTNNLKNNQIFFSDTWYNLKKPLSLRPHSEKAPWLNWIEHLTTDQKVAGSSPAGVTLFYLG
jgi:hypothetical protein